MRLELLKRAGIFFIGIGLFTGRPSAPAAAESGSDAVTATATVPPLPWVRLGKVTGRALPRFVSLRGKRARMRVGPSTDYPIKWLYTVPGLPLEMIEEWGNWRLVRDGAGASGWMHAALLSGTRTGIVAPWLKADAVLLGDRRKTAAVLARMQSGVLLNIHRCDGQWCHVNIRSHAISGYASQAELWGVYPGEIVP